MDPQKRCWSQRSLCRHIGRYKSLVEFVVSFSKLHIAAYFGIDLVLSRIKLEATELNSKDTNGWTPLTWAIERENAEVMQLLLHNHVKMEYWYKLDRAPLSRAAEKGNKRAVKLLPENGSARL